MANSGDTEVELLNSEDKILGWLLSKGGGAVENRSKKYRRH